MSMRSYLTFTALLLGCLLAGPRSAYAVVECDVAATPVTVASGAGAAMQELGDVVLFCVETGAVSSQPTAQTTLKITLTGGADVFSDPTGNFQPIANADVTPGFIDAVLTVNTNVCTPPTTQSGQKVCGPDSRFQDPQYGKATVADKLLGRVEWTFEFPNPGATPAGGGVPHPATTIIRVSGLKADLTGFGGGQVAPVVSLGGAVVRDKVVTAGFTGPGSTPNNFNPGTDTTGQGRCDFVSTTGPVDVTGTTEPTGDLEFECVNTPPPGGVTSTFQTVDVYLALNVNFSGQVVPGGGGVTNTQTRLVVNGSQAGAKTGQLLNARTLVYRNVNMPVAGAGGNPATTTVAISNLVVNASQMTVGKVLGALRFGGKPTSLPLVGTNVSQVGRIPDKLGYYRNGNWRLDVDGNQTFNPGVDQDFNLGFAGAQRFVGDWNGDGRFETGVYNQGFWFLDFNGDGFFDGGVTDKIFAYGFAGATPFVGDWNGDGATEVGVYNQGFWFLDINGDRQYNPGPGVADDKIFPLGFAGATPFVGDWDGNGTTNVGVYNLGFWFLDYNGNQVWDGAPNDRVYAFGFAGATPVTGDWDGNGTLNVGVYNSGTWFLDADGNELYDGGVNDQIFPLGFLGAIPVVGDWNGDGADSAGVFSDGDYFLDPDGSGAWDGNTISWGVAGDQPAVGPW